MLAGTFVRMRGAIITFLSCVLAVPAAAQSMPTNGVLAVGDCAQASLRDAEFAAGERARLRAHFDEVLAELEGADTSTLTSVQRQRRAQHLQILAAYRDRGVFPRRYAGPLGRVPEFRDVHGTRCAMGELLYLSGEAELVNDVAATANGATIAELSTDARLTSWLSDNGLTVAEAGRVQPGYTHAPARCLCNPDYTSVASDSLWRAVAAEAGVEGVPGGFDVSVELVERVGGTDERTVGQLTSSMARYPVADGDPLLVRFSPYSSDAYPIDDDSDTVSCSTQSRATGGQWLTCRADSPVALNPAIEALRLPPTECEAALVAEDARLGERCSDGGCQAQSLDARSLSAGAIGALLFGLLLARRPRRT